MLKLHIFVMVITKNSKCSRKPARQSRVISRVCVCGMCIPRTFFHVGLLVQLVTASVNWRCNQWFLTRD